MAADTEKQIETLIKGIKKVLNVKQIAKKCRGLILALAAIAVFASATATPAYANDLRKWQKKVIKKISKKQTYPRSAINDEIEGKAHVKITIDRTGAITAHELVKATGFDVLDNEVPKLIKRLNPLPAPPDEMTDKQLTFVLPLSWQLN